MAAELTMSTPYVVSQHVRSLSHLFVKVRDQKTKRVDFCHYSNRLMTIVWLVSASKYVFINHG